MWMLLRDACRDHWSIGADHLDGQRVNATLEFGVERFHHRAVLLQPRQSGEGGAADSDPKMRFAFGSRTSMPSMSFALIDHFKMGWGEFLGKFINNRVANGHMDTGLDVIGGLKRN